MSTVRRCASLAVLSALLGACGPDKEAQFQRAVAELSPPVPPPPAMKKPVEDGTEAPLVGHYLPTPDDPPPFPELAPPSPPSGSGVVSVELIDPPPSSEVNPLTGPPAEELRDWSAYGDESHYTRYGD